MAKPKPKPTKKAVTELSASDRLAQELTIATDASIGIIAIRCQETEVYRVVDEIYALAMSAEMNFEIHTTELGWSKYNKIDPHDHRAKSFDPLDPTDSNKIADVFKAFTGYLWTQEAPEDGFYVMLDTHQFFGVPSTQAALRKQSQKALSSGQRLFLIVPHSYDIPDQVAPLMHVIKFEYPTREELTRILTDTLEGIDEEDRPALTEDEINVIVSNGQGMTAHAFDTAVALSITEYTTLRQQENRDDDESNFSGFTSDHIVNMIRRYKVQLLRKTNVLELQPPVPEAEIGGLDLFKEWMHQRKATFTPEAREEHITPSRGALVIGPPGTGKSLVAKAAGSILQIPVIRFDVGRVFNAYIGQSEQSMRIVLEMLDAMSPIVLMLDEIDKGFSAMAGGGGNDSGTTQRVFGTFLTWMQERDQVNRPVFLIMTANRIGGLPPELLRKGRVDEIWSVNSPNETERRQILSIHAKKRGHILEDGDMDRLVALTDRLVGAEIESLIEDAAVMSFAETGEADLSYEWLEKAKLYLRPMADTRADDFKAMQTWAKMNARPASSPDEKPATVAVGGHTVKRSVGKKRAVIRRST